MKVIIDGDEYIKKDFIIDEETKNLIIEVYSIYAEVIAAHAEGTSASVAEIT